VDNVLEFERPVLELAQRIEQLRELERTDGVNLASSIEQLEQRAIELQARIFGRLTPWQRTLLARHPNRPLMSEYAAGMLSEWTELHGDRLGFDDPAIAAGLARLRAPGSRSDGRPLVVCGHQKGRSTRENLRRNFGMARPDGYRKALRLFELAESRGLPIVTFIDTPGAYPGVDAEQRGQAEAIARNVYEMSRLTVPVVAIIVGEGGSGGALALGVANRVLMLENAVYSVISPEGCAAILWRDRAEGPRAAAALRITAADCRSLGVVDDVVEEPLGGAHRDPEGTVARVGRAIGRHLDELLDLGPEALRSGRYERFRAMGAIA
jgi:acetyl-CoA carboxylase carboxyl transferase subunit alpha